MENCIMRAKTAGGKAYTQVFKTVTCGQRRQAEKLTHGYGEQYHVGKEGRRKSLHAGMENSIMRAKTAGGKAYTRVWKTVSCGQRRQAEKLTHGYGKQYHVGKDGRRKSLHKGMENGIMWAKTAGKKAYTQVWKTVSCGQRRQTEKLTQGYGKRYHVGKDGRRKSLHTGMENSIMWAKTAGGKAYTRVWKTVSCGQRRQAKKLTHRYGKQYHVGKDGRQKSLHTGMENSIMWAKTAGGKAYTRVWKTVSRGQRRQAKKLTQGYGKQYHVGKDGRQKSLHKDMENSIMWAKTAGKKAYTQVWKTVSFGQRRQVEKLTHRYGKQYHVGKDGRRKSLHTGMEKSIMWAKTAGGKAYIQVLKIESRVQRRQAEKLRHRYGKQYHTGKDGRQKSLHTGMENSIMWAKTAGEKAYTRIWRTVSHGERRQAEKLTHRYGKQYHVGKDGRWKSLHTGMENSIMWAKTAGEKAYTRIWRTVSRGERGKTEKLTQGYGKQYHVGKDGRQKSLHKGMENGIMWAKTAGKKAYTRVWKTVSCGQRRQAKMLTQGYGKQYHVGKDNRQKSLHTGMENGIIWAKTAGGKAYTQLWKTVSRGQRRQTEKLTHRYGKQYHVGKDGRRKSLHTGMENSITSAKTADGKAYTQVWRTVSCGQRRQAEKLTYRYGK